MNTPLLSLICGGVTFEAVPVEMREKVAFPTHRIAEALDMMRKEMGLREAVLLSTCNRVEYFGAAEAIERPLQAWPEFLRHYHQLGPDFTIGSFNLAGPDCVEHLFQVASGLKSMVVGETEIFGQVKAAYEMAHQHGCTGKWTNRLFQSSFSAAKDVRTHTSITRGSVSVGSVAVELAEKIFGSLTGCSVMVIGAGETSERVARCLQSRGATSIMVANRTYDRAAHLAGELGGRAVHWDRWEEEAIEVDIMMSSTSAPHYILSRDRVESLLWRRMGRPLFLVDLAVPRDFEPSINLLDDVYLYDLDDLQSIANRHLHERQAEIARSLDILKPHVARFCTWAERQAEMDRLVAAPAQFSHL
jgi:glutamyl-tRNA reductase